MRRNGCEVIFSYYLSMKKICIYITTSILFEERVLKQIPQ